MEKLCFPYHSPLRKQKKHPSDNKRVQLFHEKIQPFTSEKLSFVSDKFKVLHTVQNFYAQPQKDYNIILDLFQYAYSENHFLFLCAKCCIDFLVAII